MIVHVRPMLLVLACVAACSIPTARDRGSVADELGRRLDGTAHLASKTDDDLPPGVGFGDGLTVDEAVAVALWRNSSFLEALNQLDLGRADLVAAGQLRDPIFSYLFPWGPKQYEWTLGVPLGDLWQRPRRVAAAKLDVDRIAALLVQGGLDLVREVKLAHADWILARERARLADEASLVRERIEALERSRRDAGESSPAIALEALLELERVRAARLQAEFSVDSAAARVGALLGFRELPEFDAVATSDGPEPQVHTLERLREQAYASRPDLRACELAIEAATERVGLAEVEAWQVTAQLDANQRGTKGFEAGPGMLLNLPLFSGNEGRKARLSAELEQAAIRYVVRRDAIAREVNDAAIALQAAQTARAQWRDRLLVSLGQRVRMAEASFAAGESSGLDVAQAQLALVEGRLRLAESDNAVVRAVAELERSLGGRLLNEDPAR